MSSQFFKKSIFVPALSLSLALVGCQTTISVCNIYSAFNITNEEKVIPARFLKLSDDTETLFGFADGVTNTQIYDGRYTTLSIPKGIKYIAPYAFANMFDGQSNFVNKIVLPNTILEIGDYAFQNNPVTEINLFDITSITKIGNQAFYNCSNLVGDWQIPSNLVSIGNNAFTNCTGIKTITFSKSLQDIGSYAFSGCSQLYDIDLYNYDIIPNWCFKSTNIFQLAGSQSGETKTIKYSTSITPEAVWNKNLIEIQAVPSEFSQQGSLVFPTSQIWLDEGEITLRTTPEEFEKYQIIQLPDYGYVSQATFPRDWKIEKHKKVIFGEQTQIASRGFEVKEGQQPWLIAIEGFEKLKKINRDIDSNSLFVGQANLCQDITIGADEVPTGTFESCPSIYRVSFSNPNTKALWHIFKYTPCLSQIDMTIFNNDSEEWAVDAQGNNYQIEYPSYTGVLLMDRQIETKWNFFKRHFKQNSIAQSIPNNWTVLDLKADYEKNSDDAINIQNGKAIGFNSDTSTPITQCKALQIPSSVHEIIDGAYAEYFNQETVRPEGDPYWLLYLPENLLRIGDNAFKNCKALDGALVLPKSLEYIGENAFKNGSFHSNLTLPKNLKYVGDNAFSKCFTLSSQNFVVPDTTQYIGDNAFDGVQIETFKFGAGLKHLGNHFISQNSIIETIDLGELSMGRGVPDIEWGDQCFDLPYIPGGIIQIHSTRYKALWNDFFVKHGNPTAKGWRIEFLDQ